LAVPNLLCKEWFFLGDLKGKRKHKWKGEGGIIPGIQLPTIPLQQDVFNVSRGKGNLELLQESLNNGQLAHNATGLTEVGFKAKNLEFFNAIRNGDLGSIFADVEKSHGIDLIIDTPISN
jgi:hypothetical protein